LHAFNYTDINIYILFDTKKVVESVEDHHTTKMLNKNVKKRTYHSCPSGLPAPTFPDANAGLVYPIKSCQLSPTLTSSLCNPQNTPSSMDQNAKTLCLSLYCQDCSGSSLNLKIFYNFKGMDRP
jgi:hypothetical protein